MHISTVHAIVDKYAGEKLVVGKQYIHPKDGLVQITSGYFYDPTYGRVSNFWHWQKVLKDGTLDGVDRHGYGWL